MDAATEFGDRNILELQKGFVENEDLGKSALKRYLIGQPLMDRSWAEGQRITCAVIRDDSQYGDVLNPIINHLYINSPKSHTLYKYIIKVVVYVYLHILYTINPTLRLETQSSTIPQITMFVGAMN